VGRGRRRRDSAGQKEDRQKSRDPNEEVRAPAISGAGDRVNFAPLRLTAVSFGYFEWKNPSSARRSRPSFAISVIIWLGEVAPFAFDYGIGRSFRCGAFLFVLISSPIQVGA
jgi:hypothetical protein